MPLGYPALANLLADKGFDSRIVHLGIEKELNPSFSLKSILDTYQPKVVLLSLHWHLQTRAVIDTARAIRSWNKDTIIVLGGLSASTFALELMQTVRAISAVVVGDGEEPLLQLLHCVQNRSSDFSRVPNLVWRLPDNAVIQNPRAFSVTPDYSAQLRHGSLALLDHHQAYLERALYADFSQGAKGSEGYAKAAYLNAGRGCTASCIHCGGAAESQVITSNRSGVILYPLDKLMRDLQEVHAHGANVLRMSFDPPLARGHLANWFERIRDQYPQFKVIFDAWFLPSERLLTALASTFPSGPTLIISPECGNEELRYRIRGLPFKNDNLLSTLRLADSLGIQTHCFFSGGLPTETLSNLQDTAELITQIRAQTRSAISVCPMCLDPASPLFLHPESWNTKLLRRTARDFYEEKGLTDGPGYETEIFSEKQILDACDYLLSKADLPPLQSAALPLPKHKALLVGAFRSLLPEGQDCSFGSQGGFVDTLAPAPYSLANAYLKAFAEADPQIAAQWQIELVNFAEPLFIEDSREEFHFTQENLDLIIAQSPDLIGFSAYCWNIDAIIAISPKLREALPSCTIVIGGRSVEASPLDLLRNNPSISALFLGESELAFAEVLRRNLSSFANIPGVAYRTGSDLLAGPPNRVVANLNDIPSPFLLGILDPPTNAVMMELSRGCSHSCGYCTWNADKRLRFFSPDRTYRHIRWALSKGHRHITLIDSAINYDSAALEAHVDAIRSADLDGLVHFTYNIRHDCLDAQSLTALSRLPTHMLLLGIETLNSPAMGDVDRKPVDLFALRDSLAQIATGVRPAIASIVLGLPGDSEEGFLNTLDTLLGWTYEYVDNRPIVGTVLVSLLQVYPGSGLWHKREALGLSFQEHGVPYLLSGGTWTQAALARCKAYIVQQIHKQPERIKAAEAIVLLESQGGLSHWFSPGRLDLLLADWPIGKTFANWTYEGRGLQRDTAQAVILRFRHANETLARITLDLKSRTSRDSRTRYYDIQLRNTSGPKETASLTGELRLLFKLLEATIIRGEQKLISLAEAKRIREAQFRR